jgi:pilus assembly protein FimV
MHTGRTRFLIAIVALASSGAATALGFGPVRSTAVLGQPLNLAVPVNLAEGESLSAECAGAEVQSGENKLAPGTVRVRVTQGRDASESILRISTSSVVEEPVLTVTLSAGCPTRLSRTFVLLADPPLVTVTTASAPAEPQSLPTVTGTTSAPVTAAAPPVASTAPRAARPEAPPRRTRAARGEEPTRAAVAAAAPAAPTQARPPAPPVRRMGTPTEARPRLQLDAGQVALGEAAVLAAQEQASAARATAMAAEAAASAAGERMRLMETEMARMRTEAKAQTDALVQLRQQMALDRAQREQPSALTMALIGLAVLLGALAVWLGWRLRHQSRDFARSRAEWWERGPNSQVASVAPPTASSDFIPSQQSARDRVSTAASAWSDSVESRHGPTDSQISPLTMPAPTMVTIPSLASTAPAVAGGDESSRAMSVDEQIDLEQQADFFIALGHDDAAIDLLMAHMRSTGGGSPLPFLKLLEIHRRRDQRDAYERTRIRFNQRFNSVAPEWQADPKAGRSLIDYPLAMGRIQRAWPSPLDAMAELEALLFRRGASAELFDLPAYQEVLFLYQMARDLHEAENAGAAEVDVLLPIGGRSAPLPAAEGTIMLRPEFNDGEPLSLDLDLTPDDPDRVDTIPVGDADEPARTKKSGSETESEPESDFWGSNPDARPTR